MTLETISETILKNANKKIIIQNDFSDLTLKVLFQNAFFV